MKSFICALFLANASALLAADAPQKKTPVGVPADAKFFNGKWYKVYLERCTWKSARNRCERLGGQLVSIPDTPTQAFIRDVANGLILWAGASDDKVEGQWLWVDGTQMKYKAWLRGQPTNSWGVEHYLQITADGLWNDVADNSKEVVGYICEWKDR